MPNYVWKAFFVDHNPENPQHPQGIVQNLEIEDIIAGAEAINGAGSHPYYGKFIISGAVVKSKYVFELKFENRTIYCKTGTKGQCFEGSWGETADGDKFRKIKIWKVVEKLGWNGHFIQNGVISEMTFHKLQLKDNKISGEGEDEYGKFQIEGTVTNEIVDFKKKYVSNQQIEWDYWGIVNGNKIEGKWGANKPHHEGVFELHLVQ